MTVNPNLWEVRELPDRLALELCGGADPALVLTQGERRVRVDLPHVKAAELSLTEAAWGKDRAAFPEGVNSFRAFRARIQEAGLIWQVNPHQANSPFELTPAGRKRPGLLAEFARDRG